MKPQSTPSSFFATFISGLWLLQAIAPAQAQTSYVWTNLVSGNASGSWATTLNWNPNGTPMGADTADFSTLDLTVDSTVTMDANQSIAALVFGDPTLTNNWTLDGAGGAYVLTLQSAGVSPTISVTNRTTTINASIAGTQGLNKLGSGTLVLSSPLSTYSGFTTNAAGTLTIAAASSGAADAPTAGPFGVSTLVLSNGTLNVATGAGILYNSIIVPTGSTVAMGTTVSGVQLALAGGISGGGTLNESGSQTAGTHLSGNNGGFTGTFNSTGGGSHRVRFDSPNAGSANANWNASATVTDGWGFSGFGSIGTINFGSFSGNGTLRSDNGNNTTVLFSIGALNANSTFSGTIVANGTQLIALNKIGTGTQIFSGNNTYNGFTTISGGTLQLGAGSAAGNIGSTLITNNSRLAFSYNRSDTFAFPALLVTGTGSLSFTNLGTGIMTLNGTNNETGDTTIAAGTIRLLNPMAIPGGPGGGNLILNGTLDLNSNNIVLNGLSGSGVVDNATNAGAATLTVGSNDVSSAFNGVIKNTGGALSLVKAGAGTLSLSGPNSYKGTTTVMSGELDINTSQTGGGALTVNSGATLGTVVNSATSVATATLTPNNASALSFFGLNSTTLAPLNATNLAPGGTVTINVAGSFVSGNQYPLLQFGSYTGSGGFALGSLPTGTTANLVTNGGFIKLNVTAATPLVWKGNLNNNWDIGATANWAQGASATTYADGQTVQFNDLASIGTVNLSVNVAPAGILVTNNSLAYAFSSSSGNAIVGTTGLTKQGNGTLTLTGLTNTYTGITTVNGGTLAINADSNLGNDGGLVLDGGALSAASSLTISANRTFVLGPATGSGSGTLDAAVGQTLAFNGVVANNQSGIGSLVKTGSGAVALNGANTYGGSTTVSAGTLSLTAAQQTGGAITVANGATLGVSRTGGATLPVSTLALGSGGSITLQLGNLNSASPVITATNLLTSGTVNVALPTGVSSLGEIPLLKYGSISGSGFGAFALPSLPPGVTAVLTNDSANNVVGLLVTDVAALTWTGKNGTTWDLGATTNWSYLGSDVAFAQGSGAILDDGALTNQLNLVAIAGVFSMYVTNNSLNYTISGSGSLTGPMTLTKAGSDSLTLANLGNNSYTGGTVVEGGILDVRSGSGLGTGPITLAGGTLENNSATTVNLANNVVVQSNTTSIMQTTGGADPQLVFSGNLSGSGTLVAMVQGSSLGGMGLNGDNSAFMGTFATSNNSSLRFNFNTATAGSANANWVLNSTGTDNHRIAFGNGTISFGSLSGVGNCRQDVPNTLSILRIGDLNTNSSWGGTLNQGNASQRIGILKVGTGAWTVTASQPYTGPTTISNGILALATDPVTLVDGALAGSTNIFIGAGSALDVSGRSDGNFAVIANGMLCGYGQVNGSADNFSGGLIAPGDGTIGGLGTLTVTNTLNLGGTTWMKLNRATTPNSDRLIATSVNYGGTLVVTNVGAPLHAGDTFTLFGSTAPFAGGFNLVLPNYYIWDTSNLSVNGTISVVALSKPVITGVDFSTLGSGYVTVNATNGVAGGPVEVLTSTNLALPVSSWTLVATNSFDGSGNLSELINVVPPVRQLYFLLKAQ